MRFSFKSFRLQKLITARKKSETCSMNNFVLLHVDILFLNPSPIKIINSTIYFSKTWTIWQIILQCRATRISTVDNISQKNNRSESEHLIRLEFNWTYTINHTQEKQQLSLFICKTSFNFHIWWSVILKTTGEFFFLFSIKNIFVWTDIHIKKNCNKQTIIFIIGFYFCYRFYW